MYILQMLFVGTIEMVHFAMVSLYNPHSKNQAITKEHGVKDLGVVWQNNLKWSEHVNRSCSVSYMKLGMLRRTFKTWTNARTFKLLFTTCVRPNLEYAIPVWNSLFKKDIKKLEKVQERAIKIVHLLQDQKLGRTPTESRPH